MYLHKFFPTSSSGRYSLLFSFQVFKVCFWHLSASSIWSWFFGLVWVRIQFLFFFLWINNFSNFSFCTVSCCLCQKSKFHRCIGLFLGSSVPLVSLFISVPLLHCLKYYRFTISFFSYQGKSPFLILLQKCLGYHWPFVFPLKFGINLSNSTE